jgi:hypothetical protein
MMRAESERRPVSKAALWTGWILSVLPALMLAFSASLKLTKAADAIKGFKELGWNESYSVGLGLVELGCAVIYLIPRTSVLGAILVTGYLGGAIATHVRVGQFSHVPVIVIFGVLVWLGLYLRDVRLRALAPLRT